MQRFFTRCLAGIICSIFAISCANAQNASQLAQQMRTTGKPALIIAGHDTCVYCRQMSQELASNQEIQPLARQFFVIKVDVESKDWPVLQQAFQFKEQGIPAVFVVRADGELIYSDVGKPADVGGFLQRMLNKSGTIPTADSLKKLQKAVVESQQAIRRKDYARAIAIANENSESGSYDAASLTLQRLPDDLTTIASTAADRSEKQIDSKKKTVEAAIDLAELRRMFAELPKARTYIEGVWTRLEGNDSARALLEDAVQLDAAAQLTADKKYSDALAIYKDVAEKSPNTPAADFAQRQIPIIERQSARAAGAKTTPPPRNLPQ